jgi:hypothetical protein
MRQTLARKSIFGDDDTASGTSRTFVGYDANGEVVGVVWVECGLLVGGERREWIKGGFAFADEVAPILAAIPVEIPILDGCQSGFGRPIFDDLDSRIAHGESAVAGMFPNSSGQARLRRYFATGDRVPRTIVCVYEVIKSSDRGVYFFDKWGHRWLGAVDVVRDCATNEIWCKQDESGCPRRLSLDEYGPGKPGRSLEALVKRGNWTAAEAWSLLRDIGPAANHV